MEMLAEIADVSIALVALLILAGQFAAHELGYRFGGRVKAQRGGEAEHVSVVVAGMLALLAFVLALTLSYATSRFNERRLGSLEEANAIGTAWLRAKAIDAPAAAEVARLLEKYLDVREGFVRAGLDKAERAKANDETSRLQQTIWSHVTTLVRERPDPISASLMAAVNETFDASTAERFVLGIRLPWQIFWLMIALMLLSMASLGYQFGLKGKPVRLPILMLTAIWTIVIVNILDMASARVGSFRTDTRVYEWTRQGFQAPPAP
ncbi:hypothetical protein [Dongia sp. agr-C8]